jgi:hypothetical protein
MRLTVSGIIFLALAWGVIFTLVIYCFSRVLGSERKIRKNSEDSL